jgi:hypothetical protein
VCFSLREGFGRISYEELHRKGIPVNHKRVHRLLQDFHLSLKRTARRPKPNPLLQIVLLAGDKADLRASLLKQREPEPFELLYTDFTLLPYRGGEGKDDAGGNLGLGVVLKAHRLEGIVYNAKGRYGARKHSGHYFSGTGGR